MSYLILTNGRVEKSYGFFLADLKKYKVDSAKAKWTPWIKEALIWKSQQAALDWMKKNIQYGHPKVITMAEAESIELKNKEAEAAVYRKRKSNIR